MEFSWNLYIKCTEKPQSSISTHPFLMSPLFQKYLNLHVRTKKLVNSVVYHPCLSRLVSGIHAYSYFFKMPGFYLSPECLYIPPCVGKFWKSVSPITKGVEETKICFIKINLFIFWMIFNFFKCDGLTVLWIISIK